MHHRCRLKTFFVVVSFLGATMTTICEAWAQAGFPDSLRRYSDSRRIPFRVGTAVTLRGGPFLYPLNGCQSGLLTNSTQDRAYQTLVKAQFNEIEPGNELKMMSLWTGGAARVNGHYVAKTNLFDTSGPLMELCHWAETQRPRLTVRGHCMSFESEPFLISLPARICARRAGGQHAAADCAAGLRQ